MIYRPRALAEIGILFEDYGQPAAGPMFSPNLDLTDSGGRSMPAKRVVAPVSTVAAVKSAKLDRANLRMADALSLTLPYRDAPFDPEVIRGAHVRFYLGTVSEVTGHDQEELSAEWRRRVSPPGNSIGETNLRFAGIVDDWKTKHDKDGHWVSMEARDFSGYLLDALWPANKPVNLSGNLLRVVERIANGVNYGIKFTVDLDKRDGIAEVDIPVPLKDFPISGPYSLQNIIDSGQITAEKAIKAEADLPSPHKEGLSYWDIITTICMAEGFIPIMGGPLGETIYLRRSSDIYKDPKEDKNKKAFVWGRNIADIAFSRKLGKVKSPVVLVTGYSPGSKSKHGHVIYATYPPNAINDILDSQIEGKAEGMTKPTSGDPEGNEYRVEIQPYHLSYLRNREAAARAAKEIYHEVGRQALRGTLATKDLSSWQGPDADGNSNADLLALHAGDTISLEVLKEDPESLQGIEVLSRIRALPRKEIVLYLTDLGYDADIAEKLSEAVQNPFFTTTYKVKNVKYEYDTASGVSVHIEFSNYIVQRNP